MRAVRSRNTQPEILLSAALRARGITGGRRRDSLPGKPDLVFGKERLAVFVDGDYWHGGQWRRRGKRHLDEQFNADKGDYWVAKVQGNTARDIRATESLRRRGYRVLRFWESDILEAPDEAARLVHEALTHATDEESASLGSAADFFAGIGLMAMAAHESGWATAWANDHDPDKERLFRHNLPSVPFVPGPVSEVDADSIPGVGLLTAGFPCTDLSLAGRSAGLEAGPQSSAFFEIPRLLNDLGARRPAFVVFENVPALITSRCGADFRVCLDQIARCGYTLDAVVVNAAWFVPQSRPRVVILATHEDIEVSPLLGRAEREAASTVRPERLASFIRANPDLPWRLRPLPEPPAAAPDLESILDPFDEDSDAWWTEPRLHRLLGQIPERHLDRLKAIRDERGVAHATAFRRMRKGRSTAELRFDGLAGCLRTPKGGSAKQILVRLDEEWFQARYLSARECAKLMGADAFGWDPTATSENELLFGFGDAVCVPAIAWVMDNMVNPTAAELIRGRVLGPLG